MTITRTSTRYRTHVKKLNTTLYNHKNNTKTITAPTVVHNNLKHTKIYDNVTILHINAKREFYRQFTLYIRKKVGMLLNMLPKF